MRLPHTHKQQQNLKTKERRIFTNDTWMSNKNGIRYNSHSIYTSRGKIIVHKKSKVHGKILTTFLRFFVHPTLFVGQTH